MLNHGHVAMDFSIDAFAKLFRNPFVGIFANWHTPALIYSSIFCIRETMSHNGDNASP